MESIRACSTIPRRFGKKKPNKPKNPTQTKPKHKRTTDFSRKAVNTFNKPPPRTSQRHVPPGPWAGPAAGKASPRPHRPAPQRDRRTRAPARPGPARALPFNAKAAGGHLLRGHRPRRAGPACGDRQQRQRPSPGRWANPVPSEGRGPPSAHRPAKPPPPPAALSPRGRASGGSDGTCESSPPAALRPPLPPSRSPPRRGAPRRGDGSRRPRRPSHGRGPTSCPGAVRVPAPPVPSPALPAGNRSRAPAFRAPAFRPVLPQKAPPNRPDSSQAVSRRVFPRRQELRARQPSLGMALAKQLAVGEDLVPTRASAGAAKRLPLRVWRRKQKHLGLLSSYV